MRYNHSISSNCYFTNLVMSLICEPLFSYSSTRACAVGSPNRYLDNVLQLKNLTPINEEIKQLCISLEYKRTLSGVMTDPLTK